MRKSKSALSTVVDAGQIDHVNTYLQMGADPNERNCDESTPLMIAVRKGYIDIVRLLLESGAKIHQAVMNGMNPLMLAVMNRHVGIVKLLMLQKDAQDYINQPIPNCELTPLMFAAKEGHIELVELLLIHGADTSQASDSNFKMTPLMFAAERGHIEVVKLLLRYGADTSKTAVFGMTASMIAEKNGHSKIVDILLLQENVNTTKEQLPQNATILRDSELKLSPPSNRLFRPALTPPVVQSNSVATTVENPDVASKQSVRLFFESFGNPDQYSYWYRKNVENITLTQIIEHATGKNIKSIFQSDNTCAATVNILITKFGVKKQDISTKNTASIQAQVLSHTKSIMNPPACGVSPTMI